MYMEYGIVYLLTNPVMPGLVKIGMTTQEDIDKRMKELYTTGIPCAHWLYKDKLLSDIYDETYPFED